MHDPRERARVVRPRRRGPSGEALDAAPGGVLEYDLCGAVLDVRVVVAREEDEGDGDGARRGVGEEFGEERYGRDGGVAVRRVAERAVVRGAEGVREVAGPGFGGGRVQCGAHGGVVEEARGV